MEQRIDLDALEAAHKKGVEVSGYVDGPDYERIHSVWDALPALIAELLELRARTTPEVIGEKHRDGNWWLVWEPFYERWVYAKWREQSEMWRRLDGGDVIGTPTHALPMPPAPEETDATPR